MEFEKDPKDPQPAGEADGAAGPEGEVTMEALLASQDELQHKLSGKQVVWVKVVSVTKDYVLADIGEKNEGGVPVGEFAQEGEGCAPRLPAPGQRIPVMRAGSARKDGHTLLSYKRARAELGWEAAVKSFREKGRVRGRIVSAIKGGFLVDVAGVTGFLPASLADLRPVRNPARMTGTGVRCYVIEVNESKRQLVLSRKAVLEEEAAKRRAQLLAELRVGEVRIGRVVHVGASGVVVDIGGIEGCVRMADVCWGEPKLPAGLERGAKVKVKILAKPADDKASEPLLLGIKQLTPNPADGLRRKFPPKTVVKGKVSEVSERGVKIALEGGVAAFCAPADCDPAAGYKPGDPVSAVVFAVNAATLELSVSINKFEEIKDRKRMAQYLKAPPPLTLGQLLSPEKND
ncbi:MAG: S1 RNA-binding domain-containing protein [Elusimicrobia bacterium]|nr:S1 RNA-binding domain-containing protein [Elusimicrobiota bacterium]